MPNGVYLFGGLDSKETSEFLAKDTVDVWRTGTVLPDDFFGGCGVKISSEELVLIGAGDRFNKVLKFNIKTNLFSRWGDL